MDTDGLNLDDFQTPPDDHGLSLEDLSGSLANLLGQGSDPYAVLPEGSATKSGAEPVVELPPTDGDEDEQVCPVTPQSILEAMLFVGHPEGKALSSQDVAGLMRGVRAAEVDEMIQELNRLYDEEGCPYRIQSVGSGYRLELRPEFDALREQFYGRVKEARLSQAAIDVLSLVAYRQPLGREEVDAIRQEPSGRLLTQLVRRELLAVERSDTRPPQTQYRTTPRFLQLFGLTSLDDLPQSQDFDRR